MADVLSSVKELSKESGLLAPNQLKTINGPGIRIDNKFAHEDKGHLSMSGHALKGGSKGK